MFKVNEYFDGQVASIGFEGENLPASVGVMAIGEYAFDTSLHETMTVVSGALTVQLPGKQDWNTYSVGDSFEVAAGQVFNLKVAVETAYLCTYG